MKVYTGKVVPILRALDSLFKLSEAFAGMDMSYTPEMQAVALSIPCFREPGSASLILEKTPIFIM